MQLSSCSYVPYGLPAQSIRSVETAFVASVVALTFDIEGQCDDGGDECGLDTSDGLGRQSVRDVRAGRELHTLRRPSDAAAAAEFTSKRLHQTRILVEPGSR